MADELGDEIQRVVALPIRLRQVATEIAAGDRAGDRAHGWIDSHLGGAAADLGVGGTDQQIAWLASGKVDMGDPAVHRGGEFNRAAIGQRHLVVAGLGGFVGVGEIAGIDTVGGIGRGRCGHVRGDRHEPDVAAGAGAAGTGNVVQGETTHARVIVCITARRRDAVVLAAGGLRTTPACRMAASDREKYCRRCGCRSAG